MAGPGLALPAGTLNRTYRTRDMLFVICNGRLTWLLQLTATLALKCSINILKRPLDALPVDLVDDRLLDVRVLVVH